MVSKFSKKIPHMRMEATCLVKREGAPPRPKAMYSFVRAARLPYFVEIDRFVEMAKEVLSIQRSPTPEGGGGGQLVSKREGAPPRPKAMRMGTTS